MKHLLFTISLITLFNFSSKAQTKEETIKWITEKLNQYGKDPRCEAFTDSSLRFTLMTTNPKKFAVDGVGLPTTVAVRNNEIIITYHNYNEQGTETCSYPFSVSFDDISYAGPVKGETN